MENHNTTGTAQQIDADAVRAEAEQFFATGGNDDHSGAAQTISLPANFELRTDEESETGVFYADGDEEIKICSNLEILARTRNHDGESWGRLLELTDDDGKRHVWAMPMSLLAGDGNEYRSHLLSLGLEITPTRKAKELLGRYIQETKPANRVRCVLTVGWHGSAFVLPEETFGDTAVQRVIFQADQMPEHRFKTSGKLDEWHEQVARLCAGNSRLVFAVSIAFAASLLPITDETGGGFHYRGSSSKGKTTALLVAGSVCGGGGDNGFVETWKSTANGLEAIAAMHNHNLLCLDEINQCEPRTVGETAYMLANGQGKRRMTRSINLRRRLEWQLLFLSSGEISLTSLVEQTGGRTYGGQDVRMCEIDADSGKFGLFENLHEFTSGDALSNHLRTASKTLYGTALREYLKKIIAEKDNVRAQWQKFRQQFMSQVLPVDACGEVLRVCSRFALVAMAGELARTITGWRTGEAADAAKKLFGAWLSNRSTTGNADAENAVRQVRAFLEAHGASRFQDIETTESHVTNRVGFRRENVNDETEFLIMPESFKREVCKGFDAGQVADELARRGYLIKGSDGKKTQSVYVREVKKSIRLYVITGSIFESIVKKTEETFKDT